MLNAELDKTWRFACSDARMAHDHRHVLLDHIRAIAAFGEQLFDSELAIGEAIANSVEHAVGPLDVTINWIAKNPVLTFQNRGAAFTFKGAPLPIDPMSEGGRGLFLIHALASDVRLRYKDGVGMQLRFTLPLHKRSSVAVH